ncbi:MAG: transglutaminase-like domain-containing protein, partial [Candidatus Bathyarchaeota archaeon]|nr:transglutaminase-like domain-containing protein [Candidatus Bathyarchaeota archaeon]
MSFSRKRFISLLCLVSISLIFCSAIYPSFSEAMRKESSGLLRYEIDSVYVGSLRQTITVTNHSPNPVTGELFVPLIGNKTARHYVILHNISSSQTLHETFLNDSSGNRYFHWNNLTIDEEQTFSLELDYYVLSFGIHYVVNSSTVENYETSSETYKKYVEPEELMESNDSRIISLAHNLTNNVDSWHEKAVRIYNFIRRHTHYEVQKEERGALWALENSAGDCSEYSYLFVALCRAAGIPARIQAGFAFHRPSETLEDGHMWAEYYLENYGWIPVDVTWRLFDVIDDKHFS